jgi:ribonuclease D
MPPELPLQPVSEAEGRSASAAVDAPRYLDNEPEVKATLAHCAASHTVGLDTEFVRERTFHARPGLVQISDGRIIGLIDAVTVPDSPSLGDLLADRGIVKVLHSVGEDLEILRAVGGQWPEPLFDTQVAAAFLGQPLQLRYEHLVASALGVELDGGKARNDWCRRPLAPALLRYAAEDVIWLPRLKDHLEAALERTGRLAWHREDCARMVHRARAGEGPPPLSRVKGAGRLDTPQLAFLENLAEWREAMAQERDLPRRFVISDESLIDLAIAASEHRLASAVSALPSGQRKRYATTLEARMASVDADRFERPDWIDPLSQEQREQLKKAQQAVRRVAEELEIEPALLASKKELTRLLRGECPDWLSGWRGEVLEGRLGEASVSISALRG